MNEKISLQSISPELATEWAKYAAIHHDDEALKFCFANGANDKDVVVEIFSHGTKHSFDIMCEYSNTSIADYTDYFKYALEGCNIFIIEKFATFDVIREKYAALAYEFAIKNYHAKWLPKRYKNGGLIRFFYENGFSLNVARKAPLMEAIDQYNYDALDTLIPLYAKMKASNYSSAVLKILETFDEEHATKYVPLLLNMTSDIHWETSMMMHIAMVNNYTNIVSILFDKGVSASECGSGVFQYAIIRNNVTLVRRFIENGYLPTYVDVNLCIRKKVDVEIIKLLMECESVQVQIHLDDFLADAAHQRNVEYVHYFTNAFCIIPPKSLIVAMIQREYFDILRILITSKSAPLVYYDNPLRFKHNGNEYILVDTKKMATNVFEQLIKEGNKLESLEDSTVFYKYDGTDQIEAMRFFNGKEIIYVYCLECFSSPEEICTIVQRVQEG